MNYAHDFHAGNFADVLKHIFLVRILLYLRRKEAGFRYIETHAGGGLYDLGCARAEKTGEWRGGVLRLMQSEVAGPVRELIQPYLDCVAPYLSQEPPLYPGSPLIGAALLRPQDRLIACELHPEAFDRLAENLKTYRHAKPIEIDGYSGLKAYIPPPERRGLVLIDPPFEDAGEFARLGEALPAAARKWPTGIYMLWRPVKDRAAVAGFTRSLAQGLAAAGARAALRLELQIRPQERDGPLTRTDLLIVNPPFTLADEARLIMPELARSLGEAGSDCGVEVLFEAG
ncbi:protein of unknown function DUF519 [Methylocella silvestris BL2]|uniref:Ribosomal RNA large subunit methyltransferase J n=1 Tax=Methylocella silvestris (strain DSM 15510 / CIP 108128 / LMG 27833 / NCIMB 13906 / BL2) TaxID=395965 RepID=B8EI59_METSB|nr:23S rRNA (adenine(2030)-N(6))-methyltransferase RlmJ [Methylocella silvestris]ACK50541.1 protein of unknown function DUF519 [Methylocella silvestris BL2]